MNWHNCGCPVEIVIVYHVHVWILEMIRVSHHIMGDIGDPFGSGPTVWHLWIDHGTGIASWLKPVVALQFHHLNNRVKKIHRFVQIRFVEFWFSFFELAGNVSDNLFLNS
jgi:hypothetical protein